MDDFTRVNFHTHSLFSSDGELTPEALVEALSSAGVRYAALTDHDTLEGLPRFAQAAQLRGIATLSGVELTTYHAGRPLHLLGYGFDLLNPEIKSTLLSLRQAHELDVQSIAGSLRRLGTQVQPAPNAAPNGKLTTIDAITLLHRAGGYAFLAHPLHFTADFAELEAQILDLQQAHLDGIEAFYAPFAPDDQARLYALAQRHGLLVSAGTDLHALNGQPPHAHGVDMPTPAWHRLRAALFAPRPAPEQASDKSTEARANPSPEVSPRTPLGLPAFRLRFFVGRILLPTLLAIALFVVAIWGMILPAFEATLLDRQREMIRELTNSAWSMLASYERDVAAGRLTEAEAQQLAIERIADLRYGRDGKDYFWLQDMQPRIVMHPYRPDLNGQDVSDFSDPRGAHIFVAFADLVRRQGDGYVDYVWQWNDDPDRLAPKESYVKGFAPWGWIIGTGLYLDDVNAEIARLEQRMVNLALVISGVMTLLMLFVVQQSLSIERRRRDVETSLRASTERYHALVEATTEGALLVIGGRCRYANPTFLALCGYTTPQLDFLELADLLPRHADNRTIWAHIAQTTGHVTGQANEQTPPPAWGTGDGPGGFEGILQHADGSHIECVLAVNPITFAGEAGLILLAKDITPHPAAWTGEGLAQAVEGAAVALFRARATRRGRFVERNAACLALLEGITPAQPNHPALADLFADSADYDEALQELLNRGELTERVLHLESADAVTRFIALTARLTRDDSGQPAYIDGTLKDITAQRKRDADAAALIEKLQSSLLFLHEPVHSLSQEALFCRLDTPVEQVAAQMTAAQATAALVVSETDTPIGIVTDNDMRARVLAGGIAPEAPIHTIMSAPLAKISAHALIYEALMRMEEQGVKHLAVEDETGRIVSVIDNQALMQFQRYGPIVLTRELARSPTVAALARTVGRTPPLVHALLDSGARARVITHMLASACDAATERLLTLATAELGPPPAAFVWIAMGSQGRQEQTLLTDQDNGIIYADPPAAEAASTAAYFLRLGERVCSGLHQAGYTRCRGDIMASNPRWCRSLSDWQTEADTWIRKAEPQEVMELSIFFDLRPVVGDAELAHALRRRIQTTLAHQPAFYPQMAQNAMAFKPPFRLLGSLYLRGGATEGAGQINLKDAMMPLVSFARLYALRGQISHTHTLERIETLTAQGMIQPTTRDEISAAYDFLMQLRLKAQVAAAEAGRPLDNLLHPAKLGHMEQELLKQAFAQIAAVQKKISYDFLGGV
jgi:signal-transduction protein with cAMP-binding, CBS, and nucleotidyltransferase domain/predicted metal-dependent phosphoesterase TrpH/PAS domain-containing protein